MSTPRPAGGTEAPSKVVLELPRVRFGPGEVALVGGGPGAPDLVSLRALAYLAQAEVVIYDRLIDPRVLRWAPPKAELIYVGKGPRAGAESQEDIQRLLLRKARERRRVVRWKGGDPFVYGRGFEELEFLENRGIPVTVVPGISSVTGALTSARIPWVHHGIGDTVGVFPGRVASGTRKGGGSVAALAKSSDTLVGLMVVADLRRLLQEIRTVRPAHEPAALVVDATTKRQRVLYSTVGKLSRLAREKKVRPPAILVVGPVVKVAREARRLRERSRGRTDK